MNKLFVHDIINSRLKNLVIKLIIPVIDQLEKYYSDINMQKLQNAAEGGEYGKQQINRRLSCNRYQTDH